MRMHVDHVSWIRNCLTLWLFIFSHKNKYLKEIFAHEAELSYLSSWEMMMNFCKLFSFWYEKQPTDELSETISNFTWNETKSYSNLVLFFLFASFVCKNNSKLKSSYRRFIYFHSAFDIQNTELNSSKLNSVFRLRFRLDKQWNNNNKFISSTTRENLKRLLLVYIFCCRRGLLTSYLLTQVSSYIALCCVRTPTKNMKQF